jgi:phosphoribosylamine-glycine ligase
MRVLFVSKEGDGIGVAQRLAFEGHNVDFWCADHAFDRAGQGIVNRVPAWRPALRHADLIVADSVGLGKYEDIIRATGRPALGFSPLLDVIELDRAKGAEMFERAGIKVPETHPFATLAEAKRIPHAEGWGDGWVVKASGNAPNKLTHVVTDESRWDSAVGTLPPDSHGIVQRVVSGVEVSTEGWFNGSNFITPFNHTFEEKKFLVGDLGPTTGCMGNIVVRADSNKLTRATVERVGPLLRTIGYRGPFDINCIVNTDGAWALEATSRMGYDAVEALLELLDEPAGDFLFDVAMGTKKSMALSADPAICVRVTVPPWPHRKIDAREAGEPVHGIDDDSLRHLFLCDVMRQDGEYVLAACDGVVLKATATGRVQPPKMATHKPDYTYDVRRRVYRTLDRIGLRDKQYRTDIGGRVNADIAQLKEWGWL